MTRVSLSGDQFILFILVLKMGIMAALGGALSLAWFEILKAFGPAWLARPPGRASRARES